MTESFERKTISDVSTKMIKLLGLEFSFMMQYTQSELMLIARYWPQAFRNLTQKQGTIHIPAPTRS